MDPNEIETKLGELVERADAIQAKAKSEDNRDLTDKEAVELGQIADEIKPLAEQREKVRTAREAKHKREAAILKGKAELGTEMPSVMPPHTPKIPAAEPKQWAIPAAETLRPSHTAFFNPNDSVGTRANAFKCGQWLLATLFGNERAQKWCHERGLVYRAALGEGSNVKGGVLVIPEFENVIIDLRERFGVFRRWARAKKMNSETLSIPRKKSGLTATAVGEGQTATEGDAAWDVIGLTARRWQIATRYSTELAEDAIIDIANDIAFDMGLAFADAEDGAGFIGTGASAYHGIHGVAVKVNDGNHAGSIVGATAGNDSFETLDLIDFEACVGKLPMFPGIRPAWFISQAGWAASMLRLADAAGGNTKADVLSGTNREFLGYPVVVSQKLNSTLGTDASAIKALFGDLRMAATFGDRRGVTIKSDPFTAMDAEQVKVFGNERFDINVHNLGDGSDAGPIVALKSAA